MTSSENTECSICHLPFAHSNPIDRNACPFCDRSFGRVDGVRRHMMNCPARGSRPLPPARKRGRRLRACDACSRIKVLCNGEAPCKRCSSRNVACTFARFCTNPSHFGSSGSEKQNRPQPRKIYSTLRFLLNCTDPRVNFVKDVLVDGEPETETGTPAAWDQSVTDTAGHATRDTIDPQLLFFGFMDVDTGFDMTFEGDGMYDMSLSLPSTPNDSLTTQVSLLEADLQDLNNSQMDLNNISHQESFKQFFTYSNFQRLLTVFFRRRQLLARTIHWPTFDPSKADLGLLLAIALCGIAYSYKSPESLTFAPILGTLQQLADKYIFRRLKQVYSRDSSLSVLEVCQAAYLITILQIGVNDGDTRRRAITKRQPALVDALRRFGMIGSKSDSQDDWHSFVYRESCIRLVAFVFFNDGLIALFCSSPPIMTVSEMLGDFPCRDELWDADSPASFEAERSKGNPAVQAPCLKSLMEGFLEDDWKDSVVAGYNDLGVSNLYSAIGAFQIILFNYRTNALPKSFGSVLLRALDRWEQLWHIAINRVAPEQQGWLGVAKYSPEFALISRRIIEVGASKEGRRCKYLQSTAEYDLRVFHEFILQYGLPTTKPGDAS